MTGAIAEKYLVYKSRPVSGRQMETKEVDAERMLHLICSPSAPDARDVFVVRVSSASVP